MEASGGLISLPDNLSLISKARLPGLYVAAVAALGECDRIDECREWADRAEALASYARQVNDETLLNFSIRIKDRAVQRSGELIAMTPPARGRNQNIRGGASPKVSTRKDIGREAGLSPDQIKQALRVNSVARELFEQLVESDSPPTVNALARLGIKKKIPASDHLAGRSPADFEQATRLIGMFKWLDERCNYLKIDSAIRGLDQDELKNVRNKLLERLKWFEMLAQALTKAGANGLQ